MDKGLEIDKEELNEARKRESREADLDDDDICAIQVTREAHPLTTKEQRILRKKIRHSLQIESQYLDIVAADVMKDDQVMQSYIQVRLYFPSLVKDKPPITAVANITYDDAGALVQSLLDILSGTPHIDFGDDGRMYG